MRIFFSHSSKQKPLVREIKRYLPQYLGSWIDEERLLFGDSIQECIEAVIKSDTDYVLLFIDESASCSEWVAKELEWTLQAEKTHGRTILLSIVVEQHALSRMRSIEIQNRKYLELKDFHEGSVRALADAIASDLFALVCRDMDRLRKPTPKTRSDTLSDAESLLRSHATLIRKAVFPHRRANPITREMLRNVMNSQAECPLADAEFETILSTITQRNLIPGLLYDGYELFLLEEHASWKAEIQHNKKERIGRKAAALVQNGMKVFLDAGSTAEEVVHVLCKKIENRALVRITIATTSINIADMVSDCCVKMGFDDDFSAVQLFVPGGQVRPSTQAIVAVDDDDRSQVLRFADRLGGFDFGFIGVNGVDRAAGFTTHENAEALNKIAITKASRTSIILGDSSKFGIVLECKFADLTSDVKFIVDDCPESQHFAASAGADGPKVILA
jgi:DeoR/GlpR family transcriptional regulator of sugar metabolism